MSALATRLATLRRQAGLAVEHSDNPAQPGCEPVAATSAAMRSIAQHQASTPKPQPHPEQRPASSPLRRLLARRAGPAAGSSRPIMREPLPGRPIAPGVQLVEESFPGNGDIDPVLMPAWLPELAIARERLFVFDTETTGLAGGAGTLAFLIGCLDFTTGAARLRQFLLAAPHGEHALLTAFAAALPDDAVLVSYNGKSFDSPLIATRCVLNRVANPLTGRLHLDLLHPTRRLFRGQWENCRQITAEAQLLGRSRHGDLPGSEAPRAFRLWLQQGRSTLLRSVVAHNRHDLLGLGALLPRLDRAWRERAAGLPG